MKKLLIILLTNLSMGIFAQQSALVTYKAYMQKDEAHYKQLKEKFGEKLAIQDQKRKAQINEILQDFQFILKFTPTESRYEWEEAMPDETTDPGLFNLAKNAGGGTAIHYANVPENLYMQQFTELSTHKLVRETGTLQDPRWQITKETDTILGYPVIKAVKGYAEAWFTPSIPVPFGPADVHGLPGLVLKYRYRKRVIQVKNIKWLKKNVPIKRPKKGSLRTIEEGRAKRIKEIKILMR